MLYVNGEQLNTSNRSDSNPYPEIVEDYHNEIADVLDYYGDFLVVETKVRPRSDEKTGLPRFPGPRGLLLVSNIDFKNHDGTTSSVELRYSPVRLREENGNLIHESPNLLIHRGMHSIDVKRNRDLVYYIKKCGKIGLTPAEGKKYHIYDVKATNKGNARRKREEGAVINLIYSSLPEEKVRILAKSWGVDGVDIMDIESVRETLYNKIQDAEVQRRVKPDSKVRGMKEFIASSEVKEVDKLTAICKDAEENKSLIYDNEDRTWVIDYKDGGKPYTLKELSGTEFGDPLGALVSYLLTNDDALHKVENVTGKKAPKKKTSPNKEVYVPRMDAPRFTPEQILGESNVPKLKKMYKEIVPDVKLSTGLKRDDIVQMLLEAVAKESLQEIEE